MRGDEWVFRDTSRMSGFEEQISNLESTWSLLVNLINLVGSSLMRISMSCAWVTLGLWVLSLSTQAPMCSHSTPSEQRNAHSPESHCSHDWWARIVDRMVWGRMSPSDETRNISPSSLYPSSPTTSTTPATLASAPNHICHLKPNPHNHSSSIVIINYHSCKNQS
jgi:hypothetical protein